MDGRRLALVLLVLAGVAAGCGDEEQETKAAMDDRQAQRLAKVERAVDAGELPPVALKLFRPNGTVDISFIDGPNRDGDVVRTNGSRGKKLVWDLDQNGKIDESERTITERELYDATLGNH